MGPPSVGSSWDVVSTVRSVEEGGGDRGADVVESRNRESRRLGPSSRVSGGRTPAVTFLEWSEVKGLGVTGPRRVWVGRGHGPKETCPTGPEDRRDRGVGPLRRSGRRRTRAETVTRSGAGGKNLRKTGWGRTAFRPVEEGSMTEQKPRLQLGRSFPPLTSPPLFSPSSSSSLSPPLAKNKWRTTETSERVRG